MHHSKNFDFQRKHERKRYYAEVSFAINDRIHRGTMINISLGGAFIIMPCINLFSEGDVITVSIPYPNGKKSVKRKAEVRWTNDEGMAIEFLFR